jgi:hypothetical protein
MPEKRKKTVNHTNGKQSVVLAECSGENIMTNEKPVSISRGKISVSGSFLLPTVDEMKAALDRVKEEQCETKPEQILKMLEFGKIWLIQTNEEINEDLSAYLLTVSLQELGGLISQVDSKIYNLSAEVIRNEGQTIYYKATVPKKFANLADGLQNIISNQTEGLKRMLTSSNPNDLAVAFSMVYFFLMF